MAQVKKDYRLITLKMDRKLCEDLDRYCSDLGMTRTDAIESVLNIAIKKYYMQNPDKGKGIIN